MSLVGCPSSSDPFSKSALLGSRSLSSAVGRAPASHPLGVLLSMAESFINDVFAYEHPQITNINNSNNSFSGGRKEGERAVSASCRAYIHSRYIEAFTDLPSPSECSVITEHILSLDSPYDFDPSSLPKSVESELSEACVRCLNRDCRTLGSFAAACRDVGYREGLVSILHSLDLATLDFVKCIVWSGSETGSEAVVTAEELSRRMDAFARCFRSHGTWLRSLFLPPADLLETGRGCVNQGLRKRLREGLSSGNVGFLVGAINEIALDPTLEKIAIFKACSFLNLPADKTLSDLLHHCLSLPCTAENTEILLLLSNYTDDFDPILARFTDTITWVSFSTAVSLREELHLDFYKCLISAVRLSESRACPNGSRYDDVLYLEGNAMGLKWLQEDLDSMCDVMSEVVRGGDTGKVEQVLSFLKIHGDKQECETLRSWCEVAGKLLKGETTAERDVAIIMKDLENRRKDWEEVWEAIKSTSGGAGGNSIVLRRKVREGKGAGREWMDHIMTKNANKRK